MRALSTRVVHAGRDDLKSLGVHAVPVDLSSTYPAQDSSSAGASLEAWVAGHGEAVNPVYARLHNPTVARFEHALAELEGAEAAVAFGSGMAALSAVLLAARQSGSNLVAVRPMYGSSDHLLASGLLGIETRWAEADDIAAHIDRDTALVFIETPANPTLQLVDIAAVVAQAGAVPVLVDSTFATPVLQQPLRHGASLVLHSATKFLGGHGDVMAGVVACSEHWAARLRQVRILTGALLHPWAAFLLLRGLQTLVLRVEAAQRSARVLAKRLEQHPAVRRVHLPGRGDARQQDIARRQMRGPGAVLAFELHAGEAAARQLMARLGLITPAVSLGSCDSLLQHPASLTHRVLDPDTRRACGIAPGLLRMSVGIEAVEDLWADLLQALDAGQAGRTAVA